MSLSLTASALLAPGGWMSRFIPQLWLVPVLAAGMLLAARGGGRHVCGALVAALLATNVVLVAVPYSFGLAERHRALEHRLARLAASEVVTVFIPRWTFDRLRLEEANVRFTEVATREGLPCAEPARLSGSDDTWFCVTGAAGSPAE